MKFTFDDLLIAPNFSEINSRKEVNISSSVGGLDLDIPVISSNMDTVTSTEMIKVMRSKGAIGCLHRFSKIDRNLDEYLNSNTGAIVSFGLGELEKQRAEKFFEVGARHFCLDVAHGAQQQVVDQVNWFYKSFPKNETWLMVGNFASPISVHEFFKGMKHRNPNAIKIGVGPGSACTTRIKTGCGYPQASAIQDVSTVINGVNLVNNRKISIVADGGIKTPGDVAKALLCGADAVMVGGMLAGTKETPGDYEVDRDFKRFKKYRGSASKESYDDQNKDWSTAEGESFLVPAKGSATEILLEISGGLKSAFSYVGAKNLTEFKQRGKFVQVTPSTIKENIAHGKD